MPIAVACPACGAKLSAPDAVAGRRVKCPKCQGAIAVPDPGFEVVDDAPPAAPVPVARAVPVRPAAPPPAAKPKVRVAVADDDDDRPRSRRRDDDEDDEDDEDDRPRRKPKRKKAGGSGKVIALAAGGVAAVVFAVGGYFAATSLLGGKVKPLAGGGGGRAAGPRAAPKAVVPAGWQAFTPPGHAIAVAFPAAPEKVPLPPQIGAATAAWKAVQGDKVYLLTIATPVAPPPAQLTDRDFNQLCEGFVGSAGFGRDRNRVVVTTSGRPGRQMEFQARGQAFVVRITPAGPTLYTLTVAGPATMSPADAAVAGYLDSADIPE